MSATVEAVREATAKFTDRVSDAYRKASELREDARGLTSLAHEAIEGGTHVAGDALNAVRRRAREYEHVREDVAYRVRRAPFWAVGGALSAGVVLGAVFGWLILGARRHDRGSERIG